MVETQQVRANYSNEEEESPEPEASRSQRRRFKATDMSFGEMLDILKRGMMGRSAQEAVVGLQIKGARSVQKDQESAAKK
ncbi:hypothetical protein AB205_0013670 [Aquarana catesbeiana]|uniref:Uncharacterized protein n=1 Tax=Aquarana catesbeiana TaxID=8400 RepID=A0A2G9R5D1_AQUCT|nr:hypothetical protein AB205_0013670 [Aquarana catesbeiana]